MPKYKRILALSGGIGSGKSTVAAYLCQLGLPHLDMDQVARQVSQKGSIGLQQLEAKFGHGILDSKHELDRKKLAQKCFASAVHTATLNSIMHPLIWQAARQWQQQQNSGWVIFEIPLLIESKSLAQVDFIVMVMTELSIRKQRVIKRGFQNENDFDNIVQRQCTNQERQQAAHYIIHNNHTLQMHQQCQGLLSMLKNI